MAYGRHDTAALVDVSREPLKSGIVGKVPHDGVPAREIDRIEIRRIDLIGACRRRQKLLAVLVVQPLLYRGIGERPFQRARFQRGLATPGADEALVVPVFGEDVPRMGQFRQPQAGRLGLIRVVGDIADNVKYAFGHGESPFIGHRR